MTIWNVKALYNGKGKIYQVLPYGLYGVISVCLCMKMGIGCLYMFMKNSRFSQKKAEKLADKYNKKCTIQRQKYEEKCRVM